MEFAFALSANIHEEEENTFHSQFLDGFDAATRKFWESLEWSVFRMLSVWTQTNVVKMVDKISSSFFEFLVINFPLMYFSFAIC